MWATAGERRACAASLNYPLTIGAEALFFLQSRYLPRPHRKNIRRKTDHGDELQRLFQAFWASWRASAVYAARRVVARRSSLLVYFVFQTFFFTDAEDAEVSRASGQYLRRRR